MNRAAMALFAVVGLALIMVVIAGVRTLRPAPTSDPTERKRASPAGAPGASRTGEPSAELSPDLRIELLQLRREVRDLREQMEWVRLKYEGGKAGSPLTLPSPPSSSALRATEDGAGESEKSVAGGDYSGPALAGQIEALRSEIELLKAQTRGLSDLATQNIDAVLPTLSAADLIERGKLAQQAGRTDIAHRYFETFLKKFPNDPGAPDAIYSMGQDALSLSKPEQAIDYFERLRRDFPNHKYSPYAYFYLGLAHGEQGNFDDAIRFYQESIPRLTSHPYYEAAAMYNMADLYLDRKDRTQARVHFQRLVDQFTGREGVQDLVDEAAARIKEIDGGH